MELREDKISFVDIKKYLSLLIKDIDGINNLEFKTYKGWLVYSLSLIVLLSVPSVVILLITGLISGGIAPKLLLSVSFIPVIFIVPLTLLLSFFNNYRKPKRLRKPIFEALKSYAWDEPIRQTGQVRFECIKDHYVFRTEAYLNKNKKPQGELFICMSVPYYLPVSSEKEEEYIKNIDAYLEGKSLFLIQSDMAYFGVPVKVFPKLDLRKDIEQLLYVMKRFSLHSCTFYHYQDIIDKVPVTHEILALTVFGQDVINYRWMDWANSMLEMGFTSETMRAFASQQLLPDNQKTLKEQMIVIIREFNMDLRKEDVLGNYILFLVMEKNNGNRTVLEITQCLADLYLLSGLPVLYDFLLLNMARIRLTETGTQDFWINYDLSVDNVDAYIMTYLHKLLDKSLPIKIE